MCRGSKAQASSRRRILLASTAGLAWLADPSLRSGSLRTCSPGFRRIGNTGVRYLLLQVARIFWKRFWEVNESAN